MDNSVSAKFFNVLSGGDSSVDIDQILDDISQVDIADRERDVSPDSTSQIICRLERFNSDGDFLFGEFIRRQTDNKPPEANSEGLTPLMLSDNGGLGHSSAFRYHTPTGTFCLQNNPSGMTAGRIKTYLNMIDASCDLDFDKVPTDDALSRFRSGETRSFEITLASALNLPTVEGVSADEDDAVVQSARMLAEAYQGLTVTVAVSMGRSQDALPNRPIQSLLDTVLPWRERGLADVRKFNVKSKSSFGEGDTEVINFLQEFLQERTKLDLPDDDPLTNYNLRRDQLSIWHNSHLPYLRRVYNN